MKDLNKAVAMLLGLGFGIVSSLNGSDTSSEDPWFQSAVIENSRPVVVKFGADWCGPCRSMSQAIAEVKSEFPSAHFVEIDIDEKPQVFRQFRSGSGIPQVAIFRSGQIVARKRGCGGKVRLRSWLQGNL